MAKQKEKDQQEIQETVKVISFYKEDGAAFGFQEIEIPKAVLLKHGVLVSKADPDIFGVLVMNLTKKAREIFGI